MRPTVHLATCCLALAAATAAAGDGSWSAPGAGHATQLPGSAWRISLPAGWLARTGPLELVASHDGPLLDALTLRWLPSAAAATLLRQPWASQPDPQDVAEALAGQLRQGDAEHDEVSVDESEPATVGGLPGFRLHVLYRARAGSNPATPLMEEEWLGAPARDGLLLVSLRGARHYYFGRWREAFHAAAGTLAAR